MGGAEGGARCRAFGLALGLHRAAVAERDLTTGLIDGGRLSTRSVGDMPWEPVHRLDAICSVVGSLLQSCRWLRKCSALSSVCIC